MKFSPLFQFLDIVRSGVFILVAFEAYFLGRLYRMASTEMKKSPIISSLQVLFFSISFIFLVLSVVAFTNSMETWWADMLKVSLILPAYLVYKNMSKFREMSLDKSMKKQNDTM